MPLRGAIFGKMTNWNHTGTTDTSLRKIVFKMSIKCQENTKKSETEIPNTDSVLVFLGIPSFWLPIDITNASDLTPRWPSRDRHHVTAWRHRQCLSMGVIRARLHPGRKRRACYRDPVSAEGLMLGGLGMGCMGMGMTQWVLRMDAGGFQYGMYGYGYG